MKKIYLIFVMLFMLMFITSCSYNPPVGATEKHHTYEEVLEYAKTIDPNATVNDEYEDTKLENMMADEYREWNAIINGIECHVASTPIVLLNDGIAGGEFGKKYFVVNTDYNFYLLKSIIESKYLDFTIVEDDIADRYTDYIGFAPLKNNENQLTVDELNLLLSSVRSIYEEYNLKATEGKNISIGLYSPTVLCSVDGSNKHIEIRIEYYTINSETTNEAIIDKYLKNWKKLN